MAEVSYIYHTYIYIMQAFKKCCDDTDDLCQAANDVVQQITVIPEDIRKSIDMICDTVHEVSECISNSEEYHMSPIPFEYYHYKKE